MRVNWEYVDTYVDSRAIECPVCHGILSTQLDNSIIVIHSCDGCGSRLQLKHSVAHLTELYIEKEESNGTNGSQEVGKESS
jgi:hypothetical protein